MIKITKRFIFIIWQLSKWYWNSLFFGQRNKIDDIDQIKLKKEYVYPEFLTEVICPELPRAEVWHEMRDESGPVELKVKERTYVKYVRYKLKKE